ncbi:MAG: CocE/NonD family hydrolase [Bacteroidales bacterium]|nr:CocE/NonD family hydrolase [Bacteroidales bacterium]
MLILRKYRSLFIFFLFIFSASGIANAQCTGCSLSQKEAMAYINSVEVEDMVGIPMRDGVILNSRIYYPDQVKINLPTILVRSPYFFPRSEVRWFARALASFLQNGYVVMLNNERGRYWSEGDYTFLAGAKNDGYDVVDWIVKQSWSNGKVGTYGCSSSAEHQLGMSTTDHPDHAAMIPMAAGAGIGEFGDYHPQGMFYRGGVVQMPWVRWYYQYGFNEFPDFGDYLSKANKVRLNRLYNLRAEKPDVSWRDALRYLPLKDQIKNLNGLKSDFEQFVQQLPDDSSWHKVDFVCDADSFGVPALHVNSWYDISFGPSSMALFEYMQKNALDKETAENQFMIIAPTNHCAQTWESEEYYYGDRFLGNATFDYFDLFIKWFDYWLKGNDNDVTEHSKFMLYTMGKNMWESFEHWPPENSKAISYYLASDSGANSLYGDGSLERKPARYTGKDTFVYDPSNPVPSIGDNDWGMIPELISGSYDQKPVEIREDVLIYTTGKLNKNLQVTGPVKVVLHLSSDAKDTDLTAKLVDVYPDGKAFNVAESIQRLRWRNGYEEAEFMEIGKVYKVEVGPLLTSNLFKKGHKIRLEISSSNFPRFERNLNTGGNNYDETEWKIARNSLHYGPLYKSRIVLTVVNE